MLKHFSNSKVSINFVQRITIYIVVIFLLIQNQNTTHATYVHKKGIVAGKGIVLKKQQVWENNKLVKKEAPFWVEYDSKGDVVKAINADPYSSTVMSCESYRYYAMKYQSYIKQLHLTFSYLYKVS